jgi:DNA ligase-1
MPGEVVPRPMSLVLVGLLTGEMMRQPLLAPLNDPLKDPWFFDRLPLPLLGSPKLDGIRGLNPQGTILSRSMKPIRSKQVQERYKRVWHLDGELVVGEPTVQGLMQLTSSHVMSADKPTDDLRYYIFDFIRPDTLMLPFWERLELAKERVELNKDVLGLHFIEHKYLDTIDEVLEYEREQLALGYEGVMLRNPVGFYKCNSRATWNDMLIFKLKRFSDNEGILVDFVEATSNTNASFKDERGYAKRSDSKDARVPLGRIGTFKVLFRELIIDVSPGAFKHQELVEIFNNFELYKGRILKFRHFDYGTKDAPRFARAIGFRDKDDM